MTQIERLNKQIDHLRRTCASSIYTAVCLSANINPDIIISQSRRAKLVYCRIIISYHFRQIGLSSVETGRIINRDHATVLYLANRYKHERSPQFKALADMVNEQLKL